MKIDERFERWGHYTAGLGKQALREREESRQLGRETEHEIVMVSRKLNGLALPPDR